MKRFVAYFFVSGLMFGSLLLQYDPASAWIDTMPHYGVSRCGSHMINPTQLGPPPQTFNLCVANSGATEWSAEIKKDSPYELVPGCSLARRYTNGANFTWSTCSVTQTGNYRGTLKYWVGSSQLTSDPDKKFVKP